MNRRKRQGSAVLSLVCLFALLFFASRAASDSWERPHKADFFSADRAFSFTILPREINNPLRYFEDLAAGDNPRNAGQLKKGRPYCTGTLWKRAQDGSYTKSWSRQLVNAVAPVNAIVSNSGDYVVTFDNWYSKGYGKDTVVIYGPGGNLVREFALTDLMPEDEVKALPRSVSSIHWGHGHHYDADEKFLVLRVVSNEKMPHENSEKFREIRIELATGAVSAPVAEDTPAIK